VLKTCKNHEKIEGFAGLKFSKEICLGKLIHIPHERIYYSDD